MTDHTGMDAERMFGPATFRPGPGWVSRHAAPIRSAEQIAADILALAGASPHRLGDVLDEVTRLTREGQKHG